jgi:hypothetical protein
MTIEQDMLRWLHSHGTPEATKVTSWSEEEIIDGPALFCGFGTCTDDYTIVKIMFLDANGEEDYDWYEGELTEFIKELTNDPQGPE